MENTDKAEDKIPKGIRYWDDPNRKLKWCWERRINGKRYRTFFSTLEAAIDGKEWAERAMQQGADGRIVFDSQMQREYLAAKEIAGDVSLIEVAIFWRKHEDLQTKKTATVRQVVDEVLDYISRRKTSDGFYMTTRTYLERFAKDFGKRDIATIRGREVSEWIAGTGLSPRTQVHIRGNLNYMFKRAKALEYIAQEPIIDKGMLPKVEKKPVLTLSVAEARFLMETVAKKFPQFVPNFALRLFCGLRTAEAERMRWEWIDEERKRIVIPAEICKTRDDWVLQCPMLPETVFEWFKTVPRSHKKGAIPFPKNKRETSIARALPWAWKRNALRHTFCTMHISISQSADKTALLLRHRGTAMLFQHYLAKLVPPEQAEEYFGILPR
ncbi:MAG: hypothetical protein IJW12_01915 [Opitutales bacterium]|nr:hypothetical protein [Opitutales bacterium]